MSVKSKKQKKKTIIGWTVFLAVLIAFFFGILGIVKLSDSNVAETADLFDWDEEEIARFTYTHEGETYSVSKNDAENWVYEENTEFPLSQTYVGYLTSYLAGMTSEDRVSRKQKDLDSYGLSEPSLVITVESEDGETVTYSVGDEEEESGDYYLIRTGDDAVYLVSDYVWNYFGYDIKVIAELEEMPDMTEDSILSMTLTNGDGTMYSLFKETEALTGEEETTETVETDVVSDAEGEYTYETVETGETDEDESEESEETLTAFETAVDDLYYYWSYYSFEDFKSETTMLTTGLSAPAYTLLVRYEDGTSFELKIGDEAEDDLVYVTSDDHDYIYSIDATLMDILEADFINAE